MNAAEAATLARADGGTTHCQWCEGSWVAPLEFVYSQASGESAPGGQGGELWRHQEAAFNGRALCRHRHHSCRQGRWGTVGPRTTAR